MSCGSTCTPEKSEFVINADKPVNGSDESGDIVVSAMAGSSSGVVSFNVGGHIGCTTTTTLQKYPDSTLFRLALRSMGKLQPIVDDKGRIFIDRDGRFFRYVLNFMRTGNLELEKDFRNHKQLYNDADYFKLLALKEAVLKVKPGVDHPWSESEIIVELETDFSDPSFVKLSLPCLDYLDSQSLASLTSHPRYEALTRMTGSRMDRLQMNVELMKLGGRLMAMSSCNNSQGPLVHVLEKWAVEL